MATDFSIRSLLNLPSEEAKDNPEQREDTKLSISEERKELQLPHSTGFFPTIDLRHHDKSPKQREERSATNETSYKSSSSSIDLTRFPTADFTTIVIPKKHSKPRRKRTAFSNIQLHFLEQFFQKKAYPSSQERNFIGSILNIGSGQVKTWYQNRRTKMKKNKVFEFEETTGRSITLNNPDFEGKSRSLLSSPRTKTSNVFEVPFSGQPLTWVGSNLLLQQQNMFVQHR